MTLIFLLPPIASIGVVVLEIDEASLADARGVDYMDFDNLGAMVISDTALATFDAVVDAAGANFQKSDSSLYERIAAADSGSLVTRLLESS